jgi:hypothetical protein
LLAAANRDSYRGLIRSQEQMLAHWYTLTPDAQKHYIEKANGFNTWKTNQWDYTSQTAGPSTAANSDNPPGTSRKTQKPPTKKRGDRKKHGTLELQEIDRKFLKLSCEDIADKSGDRITSRYAAL